MGPGAKPVYTAVQGPQVSNHVRIRALTNRSLIVRGAKERKNSLKWGEHPRAVQKVPSQGTRRRQASMAAFLPHGPRVLGDKQVVLLLHRRVGCQSSGTVSADL